MIGYSRRQKERRNGKQMCMFFSFCINSRNSIFRFGGFSLGDDNQAFIKDFDLIRENVDKSSSMWRQFMEDIGIERVADPNRPSIGSFVSFLRGLEVRNNIKASTRGFSFNR